jgi:D-beta-D-heptose 7-phosphate kinase/D-beta-D-heptose 1-phosphate adenosyltransferase
MTTYCIASGYFDPLHVGHIEYFTQAKQLGEKLIVIVNNNAQAELKKGYEFMQDTDRQTIIDALSIVDETFLSIDTDRSVCQSLKYIAKRIRLQSPNTKILFVNGGDRFAEEIPENTVCSEYEIDLVDGLGKKIRSSSQLVRKSQELDTSDL